MQQRIREWRDELLQKPLLTASKSASYPKEIEVHRSTQQAAVTTQLESHKPDLYVVSLMVSVLNWQMWDNLIKVECSVEEVSTSWKLSIKKDLQKRISTVSVLSIDEDTGRCWS